MYPWVGDSLLATLAEVLGDDWTPPVEKAWTAAFGAIAGAMIEGARLVNASAAAFTMPPLSPSV